MIQSNNYLKLSVFIIVMMLFAVVATPAQTEHKKRALLVGINLYNPNANNSNQANPKSETRRSRFTNLDGPANDVAALIGILTTRYGFAREDIHVLGDDATRAKILTEFDNHLIKSTKAGDTVFFFYAGHGSQVNNSKSREADLKDETIVPADSYQGALDIRDKELACLFNQVVAKKAIFTAIFDSCHSGSIGRGEFKFRTLPPDLRDYADEQLLPELKLPCSVDNKTLKESGALIISAAQDYQPAAERADHSGRWLGLFSEALLETLRTAPIDENADRLFLSIKARLQTEGAIQEPVLAGPQSRRRAPLFGGDPNLSGKVAVAVLKKTTNDGEFELQGGLAIGLNSGCELLSIGKDNQIRLIVTKVAELNKATAQVISGDAKLIKVGQLFEVDKWIVPNQARLRVWLPGGLSLADLRAAIKELQPLSNQDRLQLITNPLQTTVTHQLYWNGSWQITALDGSTINLGAIPTSKAVLDNLASWQPTKASLYLQMPNRSALKAQTAALERLKDAVQIHWVNDITQQPATHVLSWNGQQWQLQMPDRSQDQPELLGDKPTAQLVLAKILAGTPQRPQLFISLPPILELVKSLQLGAGTNNNAIEIVSRPEQADYLLVGAPQGERFQYAWLLRDSTLLSAKILMPVITDWVEIGQSPDDLISSAGQLTDLALRLGKLRAWLRLNTPEDSGRFPYKLALKKLGSNELISTDSKVNIGDRFTLILKADEAQVRKGVDRRFIYIFIIDSKGNMNLLYPQTGSGSVENVVLSSTDTEIELKNSEITISEPPGLDNYFLISSSDAIPNPDSVFNAEGVRTRGSEDGETPLSSLLNDINARTRGAKPRSVPANWSIDRIAIESLYKK